MQLSQKQKTFLEIFYAFLKSGLNFEYFQKKVNLIADSFLKLRTPKDGLHQCVIIPVSEDSSKSNMVNGRKGY